VKLVWSKAAIHDLDEIAIYIAAESERDAEFVETRIQQEAQLLSRFPRSGRLGRVLGTRERVVGRTPFILVYRIVLAQVRILRVFRGARKWPVRL
jgi:addiction module RelE/StbE family toxin